MAWSPDERRRFLRGLDEIDRGVRVFYKYLLYVLLVVVTGLVVYLHRSFVGDAFHGLLDFYFGVLYLLFLLWIIGQLVALRRRTNLHRPPTSDPQGPRFEMKFDRDKETGARAFSFQVGSGPTSASSSKTLHFGFALNSVADEDKLDDAALTRAGAYLAEGGGLDAVCRLMNPRYQDWGPSQQQVYRAYVMGAVEHRDVPGSPDASGVASLGEPVSLISPLQPEFSGFNRWFTPRQIVLIIIVLGVLTGALLSALWLSAR